MGCAIVAAPVDAAKLWRADAQRMGVTAEIAVSANKIGVQL
jgi:hypothetical protein